LRGGDGLQDTTSEGKEAVAKDYKSRPKKGQKTLAIDRKGITFRISQGSRCTLECV
jgi:hypothetical protein